MKGNKQVRFKQNYIPTMSHHFKQMDSELEGYVFLFSIFRCFLF